MPREIEIKFKLTAEQESILRNWLTVNAHSEGTTHQIEHYIDNPDKSFLFENKNGYLDSEHYLRIRHDEQKGDSVCLKIFEIDQELNTSKNLDEIEFNVSDASESLKLFTKLGYSNHTIVDKTREKFLSNDEKYEICIDEVKDLGKFAEVELKFEVEGDIKIGFQYLYNFLIALGITEIDVQKRGYVSMLWNPDMNFGKVKKLINN